MIRFSDDDEEFLERITPPVSPPLIDDYEENEKEKDLWYEDHGSPSSHISITLHYPPSRHYFLAGEIIEVDVVTHVKQLQLLSGFLEGFSVAHGHCEETLGFQEVLLYPHQQHQEFPLLEGEDAEDQLKPEKVKHHNHHHHGHNGCEKHFKFFLTIPKNAVPSIRVDAKTGIFYRVRVGGIGEVHHYHVLPHPHHSILPMHHHLIGGVDNFVPIKVRNYTCCYVPKLLLEKPQTSFTASATVGSGDFTLKVHLFGATPYVVTGQLCTLLVTIENNTDKHTKGITIKLSQQIHALSTSRAFLTGDCDCAEEHPPEKMQTVTKFKFHDEKYATDPHSKLQTELAFVVPYSVTPTIITSNIHAIYKLVVRVDVSMTHGMSGEMPIFILPSHFD